MLKNILVVAAVAAGAYVVASKLTGSKKIEAAKAGTSPTAEKAVETSKPGVKAEHKPVKPKLSVKAKPVSVSAIGMKAVDMSACSAEEFSELLRQASEATATIH